MVIQLSQRGTYTRCAAILIDDPKRTLAVVVVIATKETCNDPQS
jgi:hypothetical protein